jgi:2-polyprenyl-3-methyl-5-hydroxy-6-metoxy-1,4-benzoquinol methylase
VPFAAERFIAPELLDHAPPDQALSSLADLVRINHYFGGHAILRQMMRGLVAPQDSFSILDVGAASGDMGTALRRTYPGAVVTSLDQRGVHLERAAYPKLVADAFQLPFRGSSFDFVFSSLFLHHFSNEQVVELLAKFKCVARRAVLAIDLERGPLAYYFLPCTRWLFHWQPISLNDGQISVQAAFKKEELLALAGRAGLDHARVAEHRPWARLSLIAPLK